MCSLLKEFLQKAKTLDSGPKAGMTAVGAKTLDTGPKAGMTAVGAKTLDSGTQRVPGRNDGRWSKDTRYRHPEGTRPE